MRYSNLIPILCGLFATVGAGFVAMNVAYDWLVPETRVVLPATTTMLAVLAMIQFIGTIWVVHSQEHTQDALDQARRALLRGKGDAPPPADPEALNRLIEEAEETARIEHRRRNDFQVEAQDANGRYHDALSRLAALREHQARLTRA